MVRWVSTSERCLRCFTEPRMSSIGVAVSGDRTLSGLCDFIEAQAPATDDVETAGARAGRWADAAIVAVYGTPDPLN